MSIDPAQLVSPRGMLDYPAPYGLLVSLKMLGLLLHWMFMHLWYAGIPIAMILASCTNEHGRALARGLMRRMPVIVAMGVNFGIVPLLFLQVTHHRTYFSAAILMAWPWMLAVLLVLLAYYGVYLYAAGLRPDLAAPRRWQTAGGWFAAVAFVTVGFLFANAFSLTTNLKDWPAIWEETHVAGAVTGAALNLRDPTLWPRWLMMFSLAVTTTAVYFFSATAWRKANDRDVDDDRRRWIGGFSFWLYAGGAVAVAATGSWYVFGTWRPHVYEAMFSPRWIWLTGLTAASPGGVLTLLWLGRSRFTRRWAVLVAVGQTVVLGLNVAGRQVVQNLELAPYVDVRNQPVDTQWGPLAIFAVTAALGMAVILWMLRKAAAAMRSPALDEVE